MVTRCNGLEFDCSRCSLSTGKSVHGQTNVDLDKVLLIVVSAYPGNEEVKQGITLAISPKLMNAGKYCRLAISSVFDKEESLPKPFVDHVFFTNAIRCSPMVKKERKDITKAHLSSCKYWLNLELSQLPPKVPILIASSEALKTLVDYNSSLYSSRSKVFNIDEHKCIVTSNPIESARYHPYEISFYKNRKGVDVVKRSFMKEPIVGSPPYFFKKDLLAAKDLVIEYINGKPS